MKPGSGPLMASLRSFLCWLVVIEISFRVSFLPLYLGITPQNSDLFAGQDRTQLFLLNGLPIILLWYAARYLPFRSVLLFVMLLVLDVFVYAFTGKVRVLQSPVVFADIFKLFEAIMVRSAAAEKMSAVDYLRFVNLLVPLVMWRHLGRSPLPYGSRKDGRHKKLEMAGLAAFSATAVYFIFVSVRLFSGYDATALLHLEYANASTAGQGPKISRPVDPASPVFYDKGNLAHFTGDPAHFLKDFSAYGSLFSFALSAKEYFVIKKELKVSAPDEKSVQAALDHLASARREGHFKGAWKNSMRPNVIVILEESMGRAALDAPLLLSSGIKAVPFMDSLRGELVFSDRALSPVLGWQTPQSEFMVLCSALPAGVLDKYGIVYTNHMEHDYVSLASVLGQYGYHTAVFHPNTRNVWQRATAYNRMRFKRYYSIEDFETGKSAGLGLCDEAFFRQVAGKLRGLPEPYFAFIISITAHAPFDLPEDMKSGVTNGMPGIDPYARKYLEAMNYADRSLKSFWDQMADIRRHSIVVIFGDHQGLVSAEQYRSVGYDTAAGDTVLRHQVPLVISAPFMKGKAKPLDGVIADLGDVAPTLLDMLDIPAPPFFVGSSLFGGKISAMDGVGDIIDKRRACNYTRDSYFDYASGRPLGRPDCEDLLREAEAARIVSDDVVWGKRYSYHR